jgi:hypothetical protein
LPVRVWQSGRATKIDKQAITMSSEADPIIEAWYHYPQKAQKFKVTALDDRADTVEIQYFDGSIDELDLDSWYEMDIERIEEPEDWTGPMDNIEEDDLNPVGTEMRREDWEAPYQELDEKARAGQRVTDEETGEEGDDWGEGQPREEPLEGPD